MSRRFIAAALALAATLTTPAHDAGAVVYSRVGDLVEIAQTSPLSFRGRVTAIAHRSVAVNGLSRRQPYTEITFSVLSGFAGGLRAGQTFVLRQMGGRSAENPDLVQMIPGFPEFRVGVEYVVFTNDAKHPMEGARWGSAGVLRVAREADGTELVLDAHHRPLVSDGLGGMLPVRDLRCAAFADAERACTGIVSEAPPRRRGPRRGRAAGRRCVAGPPRNEGRLRCVRPRRRAPPGAGGSGADEQRQPRGLRRRPASPPRPPRALTPTGLSFTHPYARHFSSPGEFHVYASSHGRRGGPALCAFDLRPCL
jgi:hypothetical protein